MAQKPFVVKNGISVNDTLVVGSNGKIHSNNAISDSTIKESQLAFSPLTSTANNLANYVTNTDFQAVTSDISDRMQVANTNLLVNDRMQVANTNTLVNDRMQVANTNLLVNDRMQVANTNTLVEGAINDALAFAVALG